MTEDMLDHTLNSNLKGTFNICQAACKFKIVKN
jgi:hypothetical protein